MYTLINAIRKYLYVQPVIAGRDADIGIETAMPTRARSARTDWSTRFLRFAVWQAAHIIVDIGTATTFDAIDENGAYQGGTRFSRV